MNCTSTKASSRRSTAVDNDTNTSDITTPDAAQVNRSPLAWTSPMSESPWVVPRVGLGAGAPLAVRSVGFLILLRAPGGSQPLVTLYEQ